MTRLVSAVALAALILHSSAARADLATGVNVLSAWTRPAGNYSDDQNPSRGPATAIDPYTLGTKPKVKTLFDVQYDEKSTYRGVPLAKVVASYKGRGDADGVILMFQNGMRIPLLISDLPRLDAFLALESCDAKGKDCGVSFPEAPRKDVYGDQEDPAPTSFGWNKLVVSKPWHPGERRVDQETFSPWRHVDSLIALEFVNMVAYRAQFAVGSSGGEKIFFKRCEFCHGVRYVGARYGWDFVAPLPLYEKREPGNLLNHVKYPKAMAQRLGIRMPPQKDIEGSEAQLLWRWMRDAAEKKLKPYRP